jgi:hypothetical protein
MADAGFHIGRGLRAPLLFREVAHRVPPRVAVRTAFLAAASEAACP